ncbi:transporter substrate-binding domain-containing protein [Duganella sp. FT134W]|uniref:Transporter substrate-binding domain-containing protein n=1 Tax=Duganella margarita TaxID=2692170 RepID=A0A7X4H3B5_9BURK|nr:transporter substrate-binding domain-containing protein [Duganella margarita]MYM74553.1 transporter substrate-binding domain-containing protein [Duganella margarita]
MHQIPNAADSVDPLRRELSLGLAAALLGLPLTARGAPPPPLSLSLALIELMPWAATTADGGQAGILVDTAEALSALSGVGLQLRLLPYPRGAMLLARRQVDLMVALQADQLDQGAVRLAPLSMEDIVVVGRPGTTLRAMADLKGKVVGRLRNAEYATEFAASTDIIKYDTNSYRQSVQMLRVGRLDAVIFIRSALVFTLKSMQLTMAAVGQPLLIGRTPLTMYATAACAASSAGEAIRDACKTVYKRQTVKALAELLNTERGEAPAALSWRG